MASPRAVPVGVGLALVSALTLTGCSTAGTPLPPTPQVESTTVAPRPPSPHVQSATATPPPRPQLQSATATPRPPSPQVHSTATPPPPTPEVQSAASITPRAPAKRLPGWWRPAAPAHPNRGGRTFSNFHAAAGTLDGLVLAGRRLVGSGVGKAVLRMRPHTSTHASAVPSTFPQTNQLSLIRLRSTVREFAGFTIRATAQG